MTQVDGFTFIGYWYSEREPHLPTPVANSDNLTDDERAVVVGYLQSARHHSLYRGFSLCRICQKPNGSAEQIDGEYIWPSGLSHYAEAHHVALDANFVERILKQKV